MNATLSENTRLAHEGTFQECFCRVHQCPPEEFGDRVFRITLYPHARWLAGRAQPDVQGFFGWDWDFGFIHSLADVISLEEAQAEISLYAYHHPPAGLFKGSLRIRVSGRRLMRLITEVLRSPNAISAPH